MLNLLYAIVILVAVCAVFSILFYLFAKLADEHPSIALAIVAVPAIGAAIYLIWLVLENKGW